MKVKHYLILIFILFTFNKSWAAAECKHDENAFRCVKYIKNYDADTITFVIPNIHPLLGKNISIRVMGLDTPELRTKDKCEKSLGYIAKSIVTKIFQKAKRIDLINIKRGKYFRIVADVIVDGKSLTTTLLNKRLAYRYDGGTKKKINWCEQLNRLPAAIKKEKFYE